MVIAKIFGAYKPLQSLTQLYLHRWQGATVGDDIEILEASETNYLVSRKTKGDQNEQTCSVFDPNGCQRWLNRMR